MNKKIISVILLIIVLALLCVAFISPWYGMFFSAKLTGSYSFMSEELDTKMYLTREEQTGHLRPGDGRKGRCPREDDEEMPLFHKREEAHKEPT